MQTGYNSPCLLKEDVYKHIPRTSTVAKSKIPNMNLRDSVSLEQSADKRLFMSDDSLPTQPPRRIVVPFGFGAGYHQSSAVMNTFNVASVSVHTSNQVQR